MNFRKTLLGAAGVGLLLTGLAMAQTAPPPAGSGSTAYTIAVAARNAIVTINTTLGTIENEISTLQSSVSSLSGGGSGIPSGTYDAYGAATTAVPSASTSQLYGGTGAAGAARAITLGSGLTMSGSTLSATGGSGVTLGTRSVVSYTASPAFDGTLDFASFDMTLTGNVTPSVINLTDNFSYTIWFTQDSTGGRTVTWPGAWKWVGGTPLVLSTGAGAVDSVSLLVKNGVIYAVGAKGFS